MASSCFGCADSKEKSASVAFLAEIFTLGTGTDDLLWSTMGLLFLLLKLNTALPWDRAFLPTAEAEHCTGQPERLHSFSPSGRT